MSHRRWSAGVASATHRTGRDRKVVHFVPRCDSLFWVPRITADLGSGDTLARPRHKHRKTRPFVRRIAPVAAPAVLIAGVGGATVVWPSGDFTLEPDSATGSLAALDRP